MNQGERKHRRKTLSQTIQNDSPVINLSSFIFSEPQICVLSKGLGFSPTNKFNIFKTIVSVNKFAHLLMVKKINFDQQDELNEQRIDPGTEQQEDLKQN